jgi:hypothetical protein
MRCSTWVFGLSEVGLGSMVRKSDTLAEPDSAVAGRSAQGIARPRSVACGTSTRRPVVTS